MDTTNLDRGLKEGHWGGQGILSNIPLTPEQYYRIYCPMKTTIDLPESLLERSKIAAAKRRTTLKSLVIEGLEGVLSSEDGGEDAAAALERLNKGYRLGGAPLSREDVHAR